MTHEQFVYWYYGATQNLKDGDKRKFINNSDLYTSNYISLSMMINGYYETKTSLNDSFDKNVINHLQLLFKKETPFINPIKTPEKYPIDNYNKNSYPYQPRDIFDQPKVIC